MAIDRTMVAGNRDRLLDKVRCSVQEYNNLMGEAKFQEAKDRLNDATEDLKRLNVNLKALAFDEILMHSDPIAEACLRYTYTVYALKEEEVEGSSLKIMRLIDKEKVIALEDLKKFAKTNNRIDIGSDKEWLDAIHYLNYLMTIRVAEKLGIDPAEIRDCYRIKDVLKNYNLGVAHAASGGEQTLQALDKIMNKMLKGTSGYEYDKPSIHEVNYLDFIYAKKNNKTKLSVAVADHKKFCGIIMEIAHKLLTGEAYTIEYKRAKGK